jgi:hypothetical protein
LGVLFLVGFVEKYEVLMTSENDDGNGRLALDGVLGLMKAMHVLTMSLERSGQLDTADYTGLLADCRNTQTEQDSMQREVMDWLLNQLCEESDVLVRRAAFQVVNGGSPDEPPNAAD